MKRIISLILSGMILISSFAFCTLSASAAGTVTGETARKTEKIRLADGTDTGVSFTTVNFSGYYGTDKILQIAEFDLSDTHLGIDVFNSGKYLVSKQTVTNAAAGLNTADKTVVAALNGDLWMTQAYGNATKTLSVSRGSMMIDRELWASHEIQQEAGIGGLKDSFGITSKNQPLVGSPEYKISIFNETKGVTVASDGLNRLPANDAIIVFNHRVNSSNYALSDSYEIELESTSPAFTLSSPVTARVKAIYKSGSTTRPSIGANTILITARGTRAGEVSSFAVGDTVKFTTTVRDEKGNSDLWRDAVDVISGHMMVLYNGSDMLLDTSTSEYPTAFIGISDSGKVMMSTICASSNGKYKGLRFYQAKEFCRQLGYNSVFYLDGGGSSTMVTLKDGTYTVRNNPSDSNGTPRAVINGVAVTWNKTPVCEKQGDLGYIIKNAYLPTESGTFIDGALLPNVLSYKNDVSLRRSSFRDATVKTTTGTNDAFFSIDYSRFAAIDANDAKFVVIKIKPAVISSAESKLGLFYACGNDVGYSPSRYVSKTVQNNGEWQYIQLKLSSLTGWTGKLNGLRIDLYESTQVPDGVETEIGFVALCDSLAEVKNACADIPPDGSMGYYLEYMHDKDSSHTYVRGETVAATCTQPGHTASLICSGCGKIAEAEVVTPALGHSFANGVCTVCKAADPDYKKPITGDVDGDGKVNAKDINKLKLMLTGVAMQESSGDINGDGRINAVDVNLLRHLISGGNI